MYTKSVIIGVIAITAVCKGQVVLTPTDLPKIGDVQISVKVDSAQGISLVPGNAGTNVLWDFSNLKPCCGNFQSFYDTVIWDDPKKTSKSSLFPAATLALKKSCYTYHSHVTHADEQECYYDYFTQNSEGVLFYGFDYPKNIILNGYHVVMPVLQYEDSMKKESRIVIPLSSDSVKVSFISETIRADGWGTLITPDTTVNALRMLTEESIYDSLYVKSKGQQLKVETGNYSYKWYAEGIRFPVLQISKGDIHKKSGYQQAWYAAKQYSVTGTGKYVAKNNIITSIYPNPVATSAIITLNPELKNENAFLIFYDVLGKEVKRTGTIKDKKILFTRDNLARGLYFFELTDNKNVLERGKIIIN